VALAAPAARCHTAGTVDVERTKIVATLGPASSEREVLRAMVEAGVDVVRLNFSHGDRADHLARFTLAREVAAERGRNVGILMDLQGPKIRVGLVDGDGVRVDRGGECLLVAGTTAPSSFGSARSTATGSVARCCGVGWCAPARASTCRAWRCRRPR